MILEGSSLPPFPPGLPQMEDFGQLLCFVIPSLLFPLVVLLTAPKEWRREALRGFPWLRRNSDV